MNPVPCSYCGINFMRKFEEDRTCNNCALRFNPVLSHSLPLKSKQSMVKAQIEMPDTLYRKIEEYCLNEGITLSQYFLGLSHFLKNKDIENEESISPIAQSKNYEIENNKKLNRSLKTQRKREKKIDK